VLGTSLLTGILSSLSMVTYVKVTLMEMEMLGIRQRCDILATILQMTMAGQNMWAILINVTSNFNGKASGHAQYVVQIKHVK
jgi:uncharacterized paraquat-inducible protein A